MQRQALDKEASLWDSNEAEEGEPCIGRMEGLGGGAGGGVRRLRGLEWVVQAGRGGGDRWWGVKEERGGWMVTTLARPRSKSRCSGALRPAATPSSYSSAHNTEEGQASCQMPLCVCVFQGDTVCSIGWPHSGQLWNLVNWAMNVQFMGEKKKRNRHGVFVLVQFRTHLGKLHVCGFWEVVSAFRCRQIKRGSLVRAGKWAAGEAVVKVNLRSLLIANTNREETDCSCVWLVCFSVNSYFKKSSEPSVSAASWYLP